MPHVFIKYEYWQIYSPDENIDISIMYAIDFELCCMTHRMLFRKVGLITDN